MISYDVITRHALLTFSFDSFIDVTSISKVFLDDSNISTISRSPYMYSNQLSNHSNTLNHTSFSLIIPLHLATESSLSFSNWQAVCFSDYGNNNKIETTITTHTSNSAFSNSTLFLSACNFSCMLIIILCKYMIMWAHMMSHLVFSCSISVSLLVNSYDGSCDSLLHHVTSHDYTHLTFLLRFTQLCRHLLQFIP